MQLSKNTLNNIKPGKAIIPGKDMFTLPETVLQFGTGVLLRGLPDYFIDKANREGIFNGRIVAVKSTGNDVSEFDQQNNLYTINITGIENGFAVREQIICSAVSRVLAAGTDWYKVLEVARSPELRIIISNTTEVGIQLKTDDDITALPPISYPGKLLAVLYERYKEFNGEPASGLVIIPTELIIDNGEKLKVVVLELAALNNLGDKFIEWLTTSNVFCNSLVDRIIPGHPSPNQVPEAETASGYRDDLSIVAEAYCLWAIEGDESLRKTLSFSDADNRVIITQDITLFRELKLRLLNGSHTLGCAVAFLSGFTTVKEAMDNPAFYNFISRLMYEEIIPAIPCNVDEKTAFEFAASVIDRFRNPGIVHHWINISVQYSTKMKARIIPVILNYYKKNNAIPPEIALGFAAFIKFMQVTPTNLEKYDGNFNGQIYKINDDNAALFAKAWQSKDLSETVNSLLSDTNLWGTDLSIVKGFQEQVVNILEQITETGVITLQ